jgi:hypothetical protein
MRRNESPPSAVDRVTTPRPGVADQTAAAFAAGVTSGALVFNEMGAGVLTLQPRDSSEGIFRSRVLDAYTSVDWDRAT